MNYNLGRTDDRRLREHALWKIAIRDSVCAQEEGFSREIEWFLLIQAIQAKLEALCIKPKNVVLMNFIVFQCGQQFVEFV